MYNVFTFSHAIKTQLENDRRASNYDQRTEAEEKLKLVTIVQ